MEPLRAGDRRGGRPLPASLAAGLGALVWVAAAGVTGPEPLAVGSDSPATARAPTAPAPVAAEPAPAPRPALGTVVLDPGHGGPDSPGTVGPNGLREGELTLDIAERLADLLQDHGFSVVMTRTRDTFVSLAQRTRLANEADGDIFISIHVNWLNGAHRGVETFFLGPAEEGVRGDLDEHGRSGVSYSLPVPSSSGGDARTDGRGLRSRLLAETVHRELDWYLAQVEPGMGDRGVKTAPFVVLMGTEMPAILVEVSTLSHPEDARLLELPAYREYIALALYNGIRSYNGSVAAGRASAFDEETRLR